MLVKGLIEDGRERTILLSPSAHALVNLDFVKYGMSIGRTFRGTLSTEDLENNPLHMSFKTPATYPILFFTIIARCYGEGTLVMTEAPTGGLTGGTALTPLNRNRISSTTSQSTDVLSGATAPTGGLELINEPIGASGATPLSGMVGDNLDENLWVLKQNTYYSVRLTGSGTTIRASLIGLGLEYTPRT